MGYGNREREWGMGMGCGNGIWEWDVGTGMERGNGVWERDVGMGCGNGMQEWGTGIGCGNGMQEWDAGMGCGAPSRSQSCRHCAAPVADAPSPCLPAAGPARARARTPTPAVRPSPSAAPGACTSTAANTPAAKLPASSGWWETIPKRWVMWVERGQRQQGGGLELLSFRTLKIGFLVGFFMG